jgi:hypothetical protein
MTARCITGERADDIIAVKIARDMPHCAVRVKFVAVPTCDSCRFLPPVLKRMEAKRNKGGTSIAAAYPKNPAFFAKLIVIKRMCGQHESARLLLHDRAYRPSDLICRAFVTWKRHHD